MPPSCAQQELSITGPAKPSICQAYLQKIQGRHQRNTSRGKGTQVALPEVLSAEQHEYGFMHTAHPPTTSKRAYLQQCPGVPPAHDPQGAAGAQAALPKAHLYPTTGQHSQHHNQTAHQAVCQAGSEGCQLPLLGLLCIAALLLDQAKVAQAVGLGVQQIGLGAQPAAERMDVGRTLCYGAAGEHNEPGRLANSLGCNSKGGHQGQLCARLRSQRLQWSHC